MSGAVCWPAFGNEEPFAEPAWYQGAPTPYYRQSHVDLRTRAREFVDKEIMPNISRWEEEGKIPDRELYRKYYQAGLAIQWPAEYGGTPPADVDAFHGAAGAIIALSGALSIGLGPVVKFGSQELKDRVARNVIEGRERICLGISEPSAGSDVANISTTAVREGDHYIVNGQKKFISGAGGADYVTCAVRTGGKGAGGLSLLLIPLKSQGVTVRRLPTQGWWTSYTAHLLFEDVRVPAANLIGKEGRGFAYIMLNFNPERFGGCIASNRLARCCLEDAMAYAKLRKTFDKRLADHQVIRHKLMEMARLVEVAQTGIEQAAMMMCNEDKTDPRKLAQFLSLLKVQCTRTMEFCAREASQVFGGNSFIRGGQGGHCLRDIGERVERIYREVRVMAIGGGSEEIMLDLASRLSAL